MQRVPTGRDKVFTRTNVGRWMREHGAAANVQQLVAEAAGAFGVWALVAPLEPDMHWIWDVAAEVVAEREGIHAGA